MFFAGSQRPTSKSTSNKAIFYNKDRLKKENEEPTHTIGHLELYQTPPGNDISLLEFDEIAMERLRILKHLENCKDSHQLPTLDFKEKFRKAIAGTKLWVFPQDQSSSDPADIHEAARRDQIGHFILRLAFCRSPENQRWLTQIEGDFLRFRLLQEKEKEVDEALQGMNLSIRRLKDQEKVDMHDELLFGCSIKDVWGTNFYRVHFLDAIELMRRGMVYLKKGFAYFPFDDLISILVTKMKNNMMAAMARSFKHLAVLEEEGRLLPRLALLSDNAYNGKEYTGDSTDGTIITRHMIDKLVVRSFPPCMKQMHRNLRVNHHLKYGARRQYGLFLKGIGLSLDEAMAMMRDEFTKKITSDKFDKEYAYNIRWMYGKEGRRVAQTAMSCAGIILRNPPSAVDCHGCPFRHCESALLKQKLSSESVLKKEHVDKIMKLADSNMPDKACTRYFEFTHQLEEGGLGQLITHPNQFYEESQKIIAERIAAKQGKVEKMETN